MSSFAWASHPTLEEFDRHEVDSDVGGLRTGGNGKWTYDPKWLAEALLDGRMSLSDKTMQAHFLDWMQTEEFNELYNNQTGDYLYICVPKRGNMAYVMRKAARRNEIVGALGDRQFDWPDSRNPGMRWTRILFVTMTFDPKRFTREEAWASLKSTPSGSKGHLYGEINRLDANLSKIFGTHGKLVCMEAQSNGYPAPHMILILDSPVLVKRVRRTRGRGGYSWVLVDDDILCHIGKDRDSRALCRQDYREGITSNPIWKNGFIDFEGVVSDDSFRGRRSVASYPFKYLTKCLTKDHSYLISDFRNIDEVRDRHLRTALWTHFCNKCFRNRDVTYGKGFRERIGLLPPREEASDQEPRERSPWVHLGVVNGNFLIGTSRKVVGSTSRKRT